LDAQEPDQRAISIRAVRARISEMTPRDLRGADLLRDDLEARLTVHPQSLEGRRGPFERTPWRDDLSASSAVLASAGEQAADTLRSGGFPITIASDCALAIGTLPQVNRAVDGLRVLWLDAHADYDTPQLATHEFLGCMSLAGACGEWETGLGAIEPKQVIHVGARAQPDEFDYAGQELGRERLGGMLGAGTDPAEVCGVLDGRPCYIHFDPDVLDPEINPVPYGRRGGLSDAALLTLLEAVARCSRIVGVEVTAFHASDEAATRSRVCELLGLAVARLAAP
jgi:arginase